MTSDPNGNRLDDLDSDLDADLDLVLDEDEDDDGEYEDEFENLIEALGLPDRLPPLWLPSIGDLAGVARQSPLLRRVRDLAAWVGERRPLTEDLDLTETDAAEAADHLGITESELLTCWETALATDLVVASDDFMADANPDLWPTDDDEEDIGTWAVAFTQVLQSLIIDTEVAGTEDLAFDGVAALMLPLFLARELGVPVAELQEITREVEIEDLEEDEAQAVWDEWVTEHGDPTTTLLARLAEHGAVEVDEETARLTPLGMLVMREEMVDGGIDIPLLPPPAEMTAAELLTAVGGRSGEELSELADAWLSTRDATKAAAELLTAATEASPAGRFYATSILTNLPDTPWSTVTEEPALRAYARGALGIPQEASDEAWLLMDAMSASVNALGELDPEAVEVIAAPTLHPDHAEAILDETWRLHHPMAYEVLTLIGNHHPDKKVAKAARTAAHKAQSLTN